MSGEPSDTLYLEHIHERIQRIEACTREGREARLASRTWTSRCMSLQRSIDTPRLLFRQGQAMSWSSLLPVEEGAATAPSLRNCVFKQGGNLSGLQLADLTARPLGRTFLTPKQESGAFLAPMLCVGAHRRTVLRPLLCMSIDVWCVSRRLQLNESRHA